MISDILNFQERMDIQEIVDILHIQHILDLSRMSQVYIMMFQISSQHIGVPRFSFPPSCGKPKTTEYYI